MLTSIWLPLCSHLFGYHYAQGLADNNYLMRMRQQLQMPEVRPLYTPQLSVHHAKFIMSTCPMCKHGKVFKLANWYTKRHYTREFNLPSMLGRCS